MICGCAHASVLAHYLYRYRLRATGYLPILGTVCVSSATQMFLVSM